MLERRFYISNIITKENKKDYLKAFLLFGDTDVSVLEKIFNRSKKTMYRELKNVRDELKNEFENKKELHYKDVQDYLNLIYTLFYDSISNLNNFERRELVIKVLDNLINNYNVKFSENESIKLPYSKVEVGIRHMLLYLNTYYDDVTNVSLFNDDEINEFILEIINVVKKMYSIVSENKFKKDLEELIIKKWISYKYNILENKNICEISKYHRLNLLIYNLFKKKKLYINNYEMNNIINIIRKYIKFDIVNLNILTDNEGLKKIIIEQLNNKFKNLKITNSDICDIQIIPKNLSQDNSFIKIETNDIFSEIDINELKKYLDYK